MPIARGKLLCPFKSEVHGLAIVDSASLTHYICTGDVVIHLERLLVLDSYHSCPGVDFTWGMFRQRTKLDLNRFNFYEQQGVVVKIKNPCVQTALS